MTYFRELLDIQYPSFLKSKERSTDYIRTKNIFRRIKIRDELKGETRLFNKYVIPDGARPDNVADELYRSPNYDWVVLISAEIINVRDEWPISDGDLYNYVYSKYGDELYEPHHFITVEVKDSDNNILLNSGRFVNNIIQLPYPYLASELTDSELDITVNSIENTVFANLFLHDLSTIEKTEDYGSFVIDENLNVWTYTLDLGKLVNLSYVNNLSRIKDTFRYIATDGFFKNITIEIEVDNTDEENLDITFLVDSDSINSNRASYITYFDNVNNLYETKYNITLPISNYEYEIELNNRKRNISVLNPIYLQQFLNDARQLMTYKESSQLIQDENGDDIIRVDNTSPQIPYGTKLIT